MKIELKPGVRYSVTVNATVGTALGMQLLTMRLQTSGFENIAIEPRRDAVKVSAKYAGEPRIIELDYDVRAIEAIT